MDKASQSFDHQIPFNSPDQTPTAIHAGQKKPTTVDHSLMVIPEEDSGITDKKIDSSNPWPWLKPDDPCRFKTDEEILLEKVKINRSALTDHQVSELTKMLSKQSASFSLRDEIGTCHRFEVHLALQNDQWFYVKPFPIKEELKPIYREAIHNLELLGILRKGHTGYCSPAKLVKCKSGNLYKVVTDFRIFNDHSLHIYHAFPLVKDVLQSLSHLKASILSIFDLSDAYHTLKVAFESQQFLGMIPFQGALMYIYLRLAMGLSISPAIWQQFIDEVLADLPECKRYNAIMDDILLLADPETHTELVQKLLQQLQKYGLKISPHKCYLAQTEIVYMGMVLFFQNGRLCFCPM